LLCTLFSELTGTTPVGLDDSFFAIGGHSLLAMKLVAKLREKLGITLPLRTLFESPNPEALAQRLEANTANVGKKLRIKAGMGRM
jgi:acyl carrier protein